MEWPLSIVPPAEAKAALARTWLGDACHAPHVIGTVTLRPHQQDAVTRLRHILARHRVALLADDVGLGKTYVAIALARAARAPVIVGPAALREMWRTALDAAGVRVRWLSYEQVSRADAPIERADLLILDEAHHARTPSTRRYERLATLASGARLLLLSATPIHNRRADVVALFALALGASARLLGDAGIAARTVRRTHADVPAEPLPAIASSEWIRLPDDEGLLERILALPPPLPPRGGGDGGALLAWTLVRLWASTRGALTAALRRRVQRGLALRQALHSGVHPTAAELAAWQCSDRAVQLAFAELLAPQSTSVAGLLETVGRHLDEVEALRRDLTRDDDPDRARAGALRALRRSLPDERIVVFTQFADSAAAMWRLLRNEPGVAMLTARGAEVAGGTLSRNEALRRFAPTANHARAPALADRITTLICTDILSEGVNLQDASVVVHLDLPWTHARLAQRVGRVRRMGSAHSSVRVFTFCPPAGAERLLAVERRITDKLGAASRTLGVAGAILPSMVHATVDPATAPAHALERLRIILGAWAARVPDDDDRRIHACVLRGARTAALASLRQPDGSATLVALVDGRATDDPHTVLACAAEIDRAPGAPADTMALRAAISTIEAWARARYAERTAGALSIGSGASRAVLRRLAATVARAPRTHRPQAAELAARARTIASSAIGVGGELILGRLASAAMPDDAWLRAVAAFAEAHGSARIPVQMAGTETVITALVLLSGPD